METKTVEKNYTALGTLGANSVGNIKLDLRAVTEYGTLSLVYTDKSTNTQRYANVSKALSTLLTTKVIKASELAAYPLSSYSAINKNNEIVTRYTVHTQGNIGEGFSEVVIDREAILPITVGVALSEVDLDALLAAL